MRLLCVSIQVPNTPDPNSLHVCFYLLSFLHLQSPPVRFLGQTSSQSSQESWKATKYLLICAPKSTRGRSISTEILEDIKVM
jgi:hypothetical protein